MKNTSVSVGGGTYALIALGVGLAVHSWGASTWWSIVTGLFWPATLGYWLAQVLHKLAVG
jgi:hypothetical protein